MIKTTSLSLRRNEKENLPPNMNQETELNNQATVSSTTGNSKPITVYQPKHPKPLLKSILKFRPPIQYYTSSTSTTTLANVAPQPSTTQELINEDEPLQCSDYLQGPIDTLCNSLMQHSDNVIMHDDITEAYSLLSARLRAEAERLTNGDDFPALVIWTNRRDQFIDAITRDIRLACNTPPKRSVFIGNSDLPLAPSSASTSKSDINEDEIMYLRNTSRLCQSAFLLLSDIFRFQTLQLIFTKNQLDVMFHLVLEVVSADSIPTLSARKTYGLAIWVLQSQRLPLEVITPESRRIAYAFQKSISGTSDIERRKKYILDGLKGINNQLSRDPDTFLPTFVHTIPSILPYLISIDVDLRLQSGLALGSFASAFLRSATSLEYHKSASNMVGDFVDSFRRSASSKSLLSQMFQSCLTNSNPITPAEGPLWAISVISALIILSGPNLFSRPRSLKLAVFALAEVKRHRRHAVKSLQPEAWKCLVWAFAQLPKWSSSADETNMGQSFFEQVYRVLKQELSGDIGVALVGSLLGSSDPYWVKMGISKSLEVIKELIANGLEGAELGAAILQRLLQDVGKQYVDTGWNDTKMISPLLLDGYIASTHWASLGDSFHCLTRLSSYDIRAFNEDELNREWDMLFSLWEDCVKVCVGNKSNSESLPPVLLDIWQSLLLIQAQFSQGNEHLTAQPLISKKISTLLLSFLVPDTCSSNSLHLRGLIITRQLWMVTRNVFSSEWLMQLAGVLLTTILGRRVVLNNEPLQSAWKVICVDLLNYSSPDAVRSIFEASSDKQDVELRKQLWIILAKGYSAKADHKYDIEELTSILINPLEHWILDESMLNIWISVLQSTRRWGDESTDLFSHAIDAVTEKLFKSLTGCSCINILNALNAIFTTKNLQMFAKHDSILILMNHVLTQSYLSNTLTFNSVFNLFSNLRTLLHGNVVNWSHYTEFVEKGLIFWIEDRSKRLTDSQYNEHVIPVYCDILKEMDSETIEIGTFYKYSDFFSSAFDRPDIPWPASGPLAFKALWDKISSRTVINHIACPNKLWSCITGLYDAYGGALPDWLCVDPQSSSQSSFVPSPAKLLSRVMQESAKANTADKDKHRQDGYSSFEDSSRVYVEVNANEEFDLGLHSSEFKSSLTPNFRRNQTLQRIPQEVNIIAEPSSNDYGLWEISLKTPDIQILKHGSEPSDLLISDAANETLNVSSPSTRAVRRRQPPTPESKQSHKRRKHDDRSLSAPMIRTRSPQSPTSLRRVKTTTSAPLDVLENLRVSVVNNAQDMGTQDLARSAKYVCEIAGILNEEISRKLTSKKKNR